MTKVSIITTTIFVPELLNDYAANLRKFGHKEVSFVVAGDMKTPNLDDFVEKMYQKYGYEAKYLDLKDQQDISEKLYNYIPFNTIRRRNFAMLDAYRSNADIIITIDDDNLVDPNEDYLKSHVDALTKPHSTAIENETGWADICVDLIEKNNVKFWHRGHPINQRHFIPNTILNGSFKSVINAGLWLDAPDTDAVTWIQYKNLKVTKYRENAPRQIALAKGTWTPMNTQNTAIAREAMPAYFLEEALKRYDDIWASYIIRAVADHMGHHASFGAPIVTQERNEHNYFKDFLEYEVYGMQNTPQFIEELRKAELNCKTYKDSTLELISQLSDKFKDVKTGYEKWIDVLENS